MCGWWMAECGTVICMDCGWLSVGVTGVDGGWLSVRHLHV